MTQADVLIVGAGAAGLMAAKEIAAAGKSVIVLEGRNRIGGRVHTEPGNGFSEPVETGAEFVHGNLELTRSLLNEANLQTIESGGTFYRMEEGRLQPDDVMEHSDKLLNVLSQQTTESSIGSFLESHFPGAEHEELKKSIRGYVEGYYAGELANASVLAFKEEWQQEPQPQYRVQEGYSSLMAYLYRQSLQHKTFYHLSSPVKKVAWKPGAVEATTASGQHYQALKIIITLPPPVLVAKDTEAALSFEPQLTEQMNAFDMLGTGPVIKVLIEFTHAFWNDQFNQQDLGFLFSDEEIPAWWTQHPQPLPLLAGWCAGPCAHKLKHLPPPQLFQKAMLSLARIFNLPQAEIEQRVRAWKVCNWVADPFTAGGYSYITTTTKQALDVLLQPVRDTIYFAGEALYDNMNTGTVEAALQSGRYTAQQVLRSFAVANRL
jgi:monoamine oxidase